MKKRILRDLGIFALAFINAAAIAVIVYCILRG